MSAACPAGVAAPDVGVFIDASQFFPRYTYTKKNADQIDLFGTGDEYERVDNVTDGILSDYRQRYGADVTKDDIFFFVYGFLHSPDYRERYAADLKKMLPRIPNLQDAAHFWAFAKAGRVLSKLHLDYEEVQGYPVEVLLDGEPVSTRFARSTAGNDEARPGLPPDVLRIEKKMRYGGKPGAWDKTVLHYNEHLTIRGIPLEAQEYLLGSRSALDWVIDRYYVRTDKASGVVNDANKWGEEHGNPLYILDLIGSIITVSLPTVEIVKALPPLRISDEYTAVD